MSHFNAYNQFITKPCDWINRWTQKGRLFLHGSCRYKSKSSNLPYHSIQILVNGWGVRGGGLPVFNSAQPFIAHFTWLRMSKLSFWCIHYTQPMGNSGDNDFFILTALLKALYCGDLLRVIALLFIRVNSLGYIYIISQARHLPGTAGECKRSLPRTLAPLSP